MAQQNQQFTLPQYAPFVFDKMLSEGIKQNMIPAKNRQSIEWYRQRAKRSRITESSILSSGNRGLRGKVDIRPGVMFYFVYDPKLKNELPFYDVFPMIFVVDLYKDGFLGINLHYLPYVLRGKLMDALYKIASDKNYTPQTVLKLSYSVLKTVSNIPLYKPCVKRYLYGHVRSRFIEVYPYEWDMALFLPVQSFQKRSSADVWRWSESQI